MATSATGRPRRLETLGDTAILPAVYVAAATWLLAQLAGLEVAPAKLAAAIACAFLTALSIYLLDRVKWRDAWLDPADPEAHPARHDLLWPHRGRLRGVAALALVAAMGLAATLDDAAGPGGWWPAAIPAAGVVGAWIYAGRPRRATPRPKDLLASKHAAVGIAIAAFAAVLALAAAGRAATPTMVAASLSDPAALLVTAAIALRVAADAIWCDLDDAAVDRRYGTASVPASLGARAAWRAGFTLLLVAGGLASTATFAGLDRPDLRGPFWALVGLGGGALLAWRSPSRVRDLAEIRLPIEAICLALWIGVADKLA